MVYPVLLLFFANKEQGSKNIADGQEEISFYGKHQAGITTPMQKNIYFVVLDLRTTDKNELIQLFKDWTDYSQKLVNGELVKRMVPTPFCHQVTLGKQSD